MKPRLIQFALLAAMLALPLAARAQQGEVGFVQLEIDGKPAIAVFPIHIDNSGSPYLQFDALMRALEVPVTFDPSLGAALGSLADGTTRFELNLGRGTVLVGETLHPLRPEHYRLIDQTLYVLYSEVPNWIPLEIEWAPDGYLVRIHPLYAFPSLLRDKRASRHKALEQYRAEAPTAADLEREIPWFDPGMFEANASTSGGAGTPEALTLRLNGVQRFLKGDLEYSLSQTVIDGRSERPELDYMRLTYYDPARTWQIQLGDTFTSFSPLLLDAVSFRGGSFHTGGQQHRYGRAQLIGNAPPGSGVDLYRQGVLLDFTTTDARGFYRFTNIPLNLGTNLFEVHIFTPGGRMLVEIKEVTTQEQMVGSGELASLGGVGQGDQGLSQFDFAAGEARYGLLPSLALGGYALQLSNYVAGHEIIADLNAMGVFLLWRAAPWLVLLGEQARDSKAGGAGTRLNAFAGFEPITFQLERRSYTDEFAPPNRTRSIEFSVPDRLDSIISARVSTRILSFNLGLESSFSDFGQTRRLHDHLLSADRRLTNELGASLTLDSQRSSEAGRAAGGFDSQQLLASYRLQTLERLEGAMTHSRSLAGVTTSEARLSWLKSAVAGSPWTWEATYIASNPNQDVGVAGLGYLFARNWRVSGQAQSDGVWFVRVDYTQPFRVSGDGFERLPDGTFGRAGLEGDVYVDSNANGLRDSGEPGAGDIRLLAPGIGELRSDSSGRFNGWGLLAGSPIPMDVDLLTTDALYTPARKHIYLAPRPGELVRIDVALVASSGLDGYLRIGEKGSISPAEGLELTLRRADGSIEAITTVEWDGAFIFEKVAPGNYTLEGDAAAFAERGVVIEPKQQQVTLPPGSDPVWLSGVEVRLVRTGKATGDRDAR